MSPRRTLPLLLLLAAPATGAETISGVCPDGSIFIVQHADAVPCREAKRVEPGDIPPLNPELLPRPYGWEVFNRQSDPYNPYNVIDSLQQPPPVPTPPAPATGRRPAPPVSLPEPAALSLAPHELDDLAAIVDVLQERAPATFARRGDADPGLEVSLARSAAFEARVTEALARRGTPAAGPVVAFHVRAREPGAFWGNLTFVQGHVAFHPDTADAAQFGLVEGSLGALAPGQRVLGYAVLPAPADPSQPVDVYWNDRRLTATFDP